MSDIIKIGETDRLFLALFEDVEDIAECTFFFKKPGTTPEEELTTTPFSGTVNGEVRVGFQYEFDDGDFDVSGTYSMEVYIERTSDGYKGRRECKKWTVYPFHTVYAP